jgi:hypothetical protein
MFAKKNTDMKKTILALGTILLSVYGVNAQESKTGVITEELSITDYRVVMSGHSNGWAIDQENMPEINSNSVVYIIRDEKTGGVCVSLPTITPHTVGENVEFETKKIGGAVNADWITNTCTIRMSH